MWEFWKPVAKKTQPNSQKSCYIASLSKKARILGMKAILFLQNHFRKMMAKFREFGIARSIMLLIFINPKDKLPKGIFLGHLSNTEGKSPSGWHGKIKISNVIEKNNQYTDPMLIAPPFFCLSVVSSCLLSCARSSDSICFLLRGREDATAEAAFTSSGFKGLPL